MPIDPSISMGVRQLEVPDPLNQLAKVTQIQAAQQQQQLGKLQIEDLLNDRKEMLALQRETGASTPQLITSLLRNPKTRAQGIELQMKYQQQQQADSFLRQRYPGMPSLFGAPAAAAPGAAAAPAGELAAPAEPTGVQVGGPIAPRAAMPAANALPAAVGAVPPTAPAAANALVAPSGRSRRELEYTIEAAKMNPYLAGAAEVAKLELAELMKTHAVAPGTSLYQGGQVTFRAPAAPTTLARLQEEMAALPPGDPRRAQYAALIQKETTHQPAAQQNVYAYTPASEEAQKDYMKGARATYDTLKNAPATLKNIEAAKDLIPSAAGFMGPGGEPLLKAASFLNNRFGMSISTKGVTDATELRSRLFAGVIDNLRKLDAQPTQAQQQALQEAIGNLGTDPNALPRVLDSMAQSVRDKVELYNKDVTGAEQRGVRFPYKPQIDLPPPKGAGGAAAQIPGAAPAAAGSNTVSLPDGRVMTFPNAKAAAEFKKAAGLP